MTSLATPAVIGLVGRIACVMGVNMALPFKVQYAGGDSGNVTMELPFTDQLAVVSHICRYSAFKIEQSMDRVSVLSGGMCFILQLVDHVVDAWVETSDGTGRRGVWMHGVGHFFRASHISFSAQIDPVRSDDAYSVVS